MDQKTIFLIIVGMALVTVLPRVLPALTLARRNLPEGVSRWLGFIPAAVLGAMLAPTLVVRDARLDFSWDNLFLWAALPTFCVGWKTKSYAAAIGTGMACVALWRLLL